MTNPPYNAIAEWYNALVRSDAFAGNIILPELLNMLGDVRYQQICDLGCGQGRIARLLAQHGAGVVGVDLSDALISIAQQEEQTHQQGIKYIVDDAASLALLSDEQFDGVICNLALMDMSNLDAVLQSVRRILRQTGWFVFSITHPCFESPDARWLIDDNGAIHREILGYFSETFWRSDNPAGVRGQVGAYHRTLSTYLNSLINTGFTLVRFSEPQATGEFAERFPGFAVVPGYLLVRCVKRT